MTLTIGVDVGGTKVAGGVVDDTGKVLVQARRDTPADNVAKTRDVIIEVVTELAAGREIYAVGIGAAGWIDVSRSTVLFAPNLAWRDEPLREYVSVATGLPVIVENDGNVAAWAEFRYGAARQADDSMVMFTIGTGVGGGIVLGGELVRGANGIAAELGHMLTVPDGHQCGCGRLGCIEQYASGSALVRFARAAARQEPHRATALLKLAGGEAEAVTGPMVTAAAQGATPCPPRRSPRSGAGSAPASPTWRRSSTRRCWSSAVASSRPATCCSARPGGPSPTRWPSATGSRSPRCVPPSWATPPV